MSLRERLRGVLGFPVPPFRKDLSLDLDALAANVDDMARHPFCGLVAAVTVEAVRGRMVARLTHHVAGLNGLMEKYVHPLYALRERVKGCEVSAFKAAMEILGKPAGPVRPPRALTEVYADVLDHQAAHA